MFRSIECFADDGRLDAKELGSILEIAERDGEIDQNEIRVLRNIISRVKPDEIDDNMKQKMAEVLEKIGA